MAPVNGVCVIGLKLCLLYCTQVPGKEKQSRADDDRKVK